MASSSQAAAPVEAGWIKDARSKLQTAFNQACAKPFFDKDEAGNHVRLIHRHIKPIFRLSVSP